MQLRVVVFFFFTPECAWKYRTFGGEIGGEIPVQAPAVIVGAFLGGLLELCSVIVVLCAEACSLC